MRNSMNPYGGVNPLIDKMIGNAYDIVKYVAKYLKEIRYVAENMEYVYVAANGNRTVLSATGDGSGDPMTIPLPDDFDLTTVQMITAIALYNGDTVTMPAPDTYEISISGGEVNIQMHTNAAQVVSAVFKITLVTAESE